MKSTGYLLVLFFVWLVSGCSNDHSPSSKLRYAKQAVHEEVARVFVNNPKVVKFIHITFFDRNVTGDERYLRERFCGEITVTDNNVKTPQPVRFMVYFVGGARPNLFGQPPLHSFVYLEPETDVLTRGPMTSFTEDPKISREQIAYSCKEIPNGVPALPIPPDWSSHSTH